MRRFQRIKLVDMIYGSTYRRRVCIDTTMNSHRVEVWGSAIKIQYFVMQPTSNHKIIWIRSIAFILPPPLIAWHNNCLHRRHRTCTPTTHPHTSLILYWRSRGACAAIVIWQSTSVIEGVVDNNDTHKTSVMMRLD